MQVKSNYDNIKTERSLLWPLTWKKCLRNKENLMYFENTCLRYTAQFFMSSVSFPTIT